MRSVKQGGVETVEKTSGTYDSIYVNATLFGETADTAIVNTDFDPTNVKIEVYLKRDKKTYTIKSDDLQILGTFNTFKKGYDEFVNGITKVAPAENVKPVTIRLAKLRFGGHIRVNAGDTLLCRVKLADTGVFSNTIDSEKSFVEFDFIDSIGYETHIPMTVSETVTQGQSSQDFGLGNNVTKIMFMNFDKADYSAEVISSMNLKSDRLDLSLTFDQILARHILQFDNAAPIKYVAGSTPVKRTYPYLPQTFVLFDGGVDNHELQSASLELYFNKTNVTANNNVIIYQTYETNPAMVNRALSRMRKHKNEKLQQINAA